MSLRKCLRFTLIALACACLAAWMPTFLSSQNSTAIPLAILVVDTPEKAQDALSLLKNGEDFARLAREKSIDPTAPDGGYLGTVEPSSLRMELREALQGVAPGQLSRAVRIPAGYAILKVLTEPERAKFAGSSKQPAAQGAEQFAMSGPGNIQYVANVAGFLEVNALFTHMVKPEGWEQDLQGLCEYRNLAVSTGQQRLQDHVAELKRDPASNAKQLVDAYYSLAQVLVFQGKLDDAIENWEAAHKVAAAYLPDEVPVMQEALGIAYLHRAGMENAAFHSSAVGCLFPLRPEARYRNTVSSEKAAQYFLRYLDRKPDDLEVRWLLNLAYMTEGKYPAAVPRPYLIPEAAMAPKADFARFVDVAPEAGLDGFNMAGGAIVDDFDNDGRLDVVTSTMDDCGPMHYYHNDGDGHFTDRSAQAGLSSQLGGLNSIQADYNNDGCVDILVLRGGWQYPKRKSLLRNNCDGTFTDVTRQSGLAEPATATQTAVWTDIDNDGRLDLFVGNENAPAQLFWNQGDGTFVDIARAAGVDRVAFAKGVVAGDYDNDGYPDLYVSNFHGENLLYHNNHDKTFTEVAKKLGVDKPSTGFATWFFDYNNDGWPDLFVASYFTSDVEVMRSYLHLPGQAETLRLYKNLGNGSFADVTKEAGLDRVLMPMGANFGDIDNDGFLDLYLGMGNPSFGAVLPHVLFRNRDGKSFEDVTAASGTGILHKGHAVAFADIDNDGNEEIFTETGGAVPSDSHVNVLFKGPPSANDWINVLLVGEKTNRSAIGARIKLTVENEGQGQRSIHRTVGSGGSFGASPFQQHIGLGRNARIESLEIWWPASKTRQTFRDVGKNQFIEIKEFAGNFTRLERKPIPLGRATLRAAAGRR